MFGSYYCYGFLLGMRVCRVPACLHVSHNLLDSITCRHFNILIVSRTLTETMKMSICAAWVKTGWLKIKSTEKQEICDRVLNSVLWLIPKLMSQFLWEWITNRRRRRDSKLLMILRLAEKSKVVAPKTGSISDRWLFSLLAFAQILTEKMAIT